MNNDVSIPKTGLNIGFDLDGVLFCTLCAWHLENDPAERKKWVEWAKTEAAN
jgi:hypothetical protein